MALSEHERNVLDRLEQEFRPGATPEAAPSPWRPTGRRRLVLASAGLAFGTVLMLVALVMDSAGGIVVALLAYGIVTGCSAVLVDGTGRSRAALRQRVQSVETSPRPRGLR